MVVYAAAGNDGGRPSAGVYDVDIGLVPGRRRAAADGADFRFQPEVEPFRQVIDAQERYAYAEVDEIAVLEEFSAPRCDEGPSS